MDWIRQHEAELGLALQAAMVIIWIFYLQLFVVGYVQQRRPNVLIHRGAGVGDDARCLVSNMGAEPMHLTSIIADVGLDGATHRTFVTDREEIARKDLGRPSEGTNRGPVASADFVDVGGFDQLLQRAMRHLDREKEIGKVRSLDLIVLCGSGHSGLLVAARRRFIVGWSQGTRRFIPVTSLTEQITSRRDRRRLRAVLEDALRDEADRLDPAS